MKNPMPGWLPAACLAAFLLPPLHGASTAVVIADGVNLRARPDAHSEIIGQLAKGRRLTVLEDVSGPRASGVKALWSRVALPSDTPVWVFGDFINPENQRVVATMLNVRAGPGQEHASLGVLLKGERVEILGRQGNWLKIKAPIGTYGFVAAEYLQTISLGGAPKASGPGTPPLHPAATPEPSPVEKPGGDSAAAANTADTHPGPPGSSVSNATTATSVEAASASEPIPADTAPQPDAASMLSPTAEPAESPEPTPVRVPTVQPVSPRPIAAGPGVAGTEPSEGALSSPADEAESSATLAPPAAQASTASVPVVRETVPSSSVAVPTAQAAAARQAIPVSPKVPGLEAARPRRIAVREGVVRRALSIQAPGSYELRHAVTGDRLVYLYPARAGLRLKRFLGRRVLVRGEEFIDVRWPATPVLLVEHITLAP